jgi:hypothetical protein
MDSGEVLVFKINENSDHVPRETDDEMNELGSAKCSF